MTKIYAALMGLSVLAAVLACGLAGCVETGRNRTSITPEITGGWSARRPGVAAAMPRPEGLASQFQTKGYYRVGKTDTLVSIAERLYGDERVAYRIQEANKDLLVEAGGLKRGLVIALPDIEPRDVTDFPELRP